MISARFVGQIGNQMWQYCLAKILAERTGQAYLPDENWLDKAGQPLAWNGPQYLTPRISHGRVVLGTPQKITGQFWLDLDAIDRNRPINLNFGYWQRYELLKPWKYKIWNSWLPITCPLPRTDPDAIYIHVRRRDYVCNQDGSPMDPRHQCVAATLDEYAACLERFPAGGRLGRRIVLLTDDPADPFLLEFRKFGTMSLVHDTWDADFLTMLAARQLIISQSTFSWWAGFLGKASKIVCPMFPNTLWWYGKDLIGAPAPGEPDFPNLIVDDEPRWEWVTE